MLRQITAKSLQMGGIVLTGLALFTGLVEQSMSMEILILALAVVVFFAGWSLDETEGK